MFGKENLSKMTLTMKVNPIARFTNQLKNSGVIRGLNSQLRSKLYEQLKLKSEKGGAVLIGDSKNRLSLKSRSAFAPT